MVDDLDDRRLCPDGSCIGLLGADGRCKVCGRVGEAAPAGAADDGDGEDDEDDDDDDIGADDGDSDDGDSDSDDSDDDDDDDTEDSDDDLDSDAAATAAPFDDDRELCPDGACIGVLGPDGRCKICGRSAAARTGS